MFKPAKKKSFKGKEKVDFKLEFHAIRVPHRGWDKLLVSLISLETNKVTSKTGKALVKNGACQWLEPVFESPFLVQESGGKDTSKAIYKLMVSMGLSRFGILGEATINLADYVQAVLPVSLPLQLQNCSSGTILHVKIQRVGPKTGSREIDNQREMLLEEDCKPAFFDVSQRGYVQKSADLPALADKDDSASTSRLSSESVEGPQTPEVCESRLYSREGRGEELASPSSSIGSCSGRQELGNIFHDCGRISKTDNQRFMGEYNALVENSNLIFSPLQSSKPSENNTRADSHLVRDAWPSWGNGRSNELEVAETMIKELRLEAVSWEQQVKKMEVQLEVLNKQLSDESTRNGELQRSLTTLGEEHDSMKLEMNKLQFTNKAHERVADGFKWQELQEELEYEKSMNSNLSLQLRKTQESNTELLLGIQDLERLVQEKDGLEKQSNEVLQSKNILQQEKAEKELKKMVDSLKKELQELERDSKELTEENMDLISQLKQANDKLKHNESTITHLEAKINSESYLYTEMETEKLRNNIEEMRVKLKDCKESHESKLATSRTLIDDLNSSIMMVRTKNARLERELQASEEHISELLKEIESSKSEIAGHEREKSIQKGQLKGLREKAIKAEQDHMSALKRAEELELINKELKGEKTRDLAAIEKQLEDFQGHALATDSKYRDAMKEMSHVREEKLKLDKELATLLQTKEAAEATVVQVQSFNIVLQEKLHLEQLKNSELLQQCEEMKVKSTQLCENVEVNKTQLQVWEQTVKDLKIVGKEMEENAGSLQEENTLCRSHAKELELRVASLEEEKHALQTARAMCQAELQSFQIANDELSEKLKNAQEDVDWARENTNTLVNEIRELEAEIESDMVVQKQLKQSVAEIELQKHGLQNQLEELSKRNEHLEKEVLLLEEWRKDASNEKDVYLASIQEQKNAHDNLEASLQAVIKQQEAKIQQLLVSNGENRIQQALLDATILREEKAELEGKLKRLQDMLDQAKKDVSDDENKLERALLESSILADEKLELEENVLKLEEMLKQAEKSAISLKQNLDFQFHEATVIEQDMMKKLDRATAEVQVLQNEKLDYLQKIMALQAQCAAGDLEKKRVSAAMSKKECELEVLQREKEDKDRGLACLKEEKEKFKVSLGIAEREMATLKEASSLWEQSKVSLEELILHLKCELEVLQGEKEDKESVLAVLKEEKEKLKASLEIAVLKEEKDKLKASLEIAQQEMETLREASSLWEQSKASMEEHILHPQGDVSKEHNIYLDELRHRLSQQERYTEELKEKVISLEEELQHKSTAFVSLEQELKDNELLFSDNDSSRSLSTSIVQLCSVPPTCDTEMTRDWHGKAVPIEREPKSKVPELESLKQQIKEQHSQLSSKIEQLQLANNQLVKEQSSANMDQLVKELNSLQNQNAALCERENELLSKIHSQEALQIERDSLKEEKRVLELALSNFNASVNGENFSKRIAALEMELTEVLEENIMYKKELQSAFAKQHNVHAAALENLGSVENVIQDLADLKRKNMLLEDDLKDMRERYFNMSLQFAEVEAEREELVMTIRTLRGAKKLIPRRSAVF